MFEKIKQNKKKTIVIGTVVIVITGFGYYMYKEPAVSSGQIKVVNTTSAQTQTMDAIPGTQQGAVSDIKAGEYAMVIGEQKDAGIELARAVIVGDSLDKVQTLSFRGGRSATSTDGFADGAATSSGRGFGSRQAEGNGASSGSGVRGDGTTGTSTRGAFGGRGGSGGSAIVRTVGKVASVDNGTVTIQQEDGNSVLVELPASVRVTVVQ